MNGNKGFIDTSAILRLLIKDDPAKAGAVEKLLKESKEKGITLFILPVTILEIVWVAEKVYRLGRKTIRELVEAILNTHELKCPLERVFRQALITYETQKIKFADAVMGYWGLEDGISTVCTYDEDDFKKISGLQVRKP
ncbi:MAG: type II toxin-antitoxin system VapC family toxin [Deltaproteobacteria bacterium]|nr:type II toxin-antitoxin system VapC family toxin [Deltaproteobacteria bacterium]